MTYRIAEGWTRLGRILGFLFLAAGLTYIVVFLADPKEMPLWVVFVGTGVFGSLGIWSLKVGFGGEAYSVELSDLGVRKRPTDPWIPWTSVVGARRRPKLQRLELIGPAGPLDIHLEYQLAAFDEALAKILESMPPAAEQALTRFGRPAWSHPLIALCLMGGLGALGIWAFFSGDHWGGLLLVLVSIAAAVQEFRKQVSSIEIRDRSIVVRTLLRPRAIAFDDISDVRIALKSAGNGYSILDVALVRNDDSAESVLPIGCDPISLYRTLKSELGH